MPEFPVSDAEPAAAAASPDGGRPSGGGPEPSLLESWARSAALAYVVILAIAALAIGLRWPAIEWAFDVRRLFR